MEEYAAKVEKIMAKAYPDAVGTQLYEDLSVEHLVGGLSDTSMIYDVLTKKPRSVEAAMHLIRWHESCRVIQKTCSAVRQVIVEDQEGDDDQTYGTEGRSQSHKITKKTYQCYACNLRGHIKRDCPNKK